MVADRAWYGRECCQASNQYIEQLLFSLDCSQIRQLSRDGEDAPSTGKQFEG